jgi:hypothetical protein
MHLTERLGLDSGRLVTPRESEVLSAFAQLFMEEDYLFLRSGPTITVTADFGTTIVAVPSADQFSARVRLVMVPEVALSPAQIKNVIAAASAEQEADKKLLVVERADQPLFIAAEVALQRPYTRDELLAVFGDFAGRTDVALGDALRAAGADVEEALSSSGWRAHDALETGPKRDWLKLSR